MKIALCLSGQPRSFEKGFDYHYKNLLSKYDVDVFFHTWHYDFFEGYNRLIHLYNPKKIQIDRPLENDYPKNFRYCPYNIISSFYSVSKSLELCDDYEAENDIEYDWIIRSRFDFALNFIPEFDVYNRDYIYVPESMNINYICDQFAIGNNENMRKYGHVYDNISYFIGQGMKVGGESMITENLKLYGIKWKVLNMNNPFPPGLYDGMENSLIRDEFEYWSKV